LKKIVFYLLALIIISSPINKFFLSIGVRIQYYELIGILFIFSILIFKKIKADNIIFSDIHFYLILQWLYGIILFFSLSSFIYLDKSINEFYFFLKGFSLFLTLQLIITALFLFLKSSSIIIKKRVLDIFVIAILSSGIYGILQIFLFIFYSIDIDNIISNLIPFSGFELDITGSALGSFFRLSGFTGDPSVQASFSILPIILLTYFIFVEKKHSYLISYILIIISFILTMSGSGIVGLSISFFIIIISKFKSFSFSIIFKGLLFFSPIILLIYFNYEDVQFFFNHKFQEDGTTKVHAEIAKKAFNLGLDYPLFGVGFNNFSFVYEKYYGDPSYNAHNSWLNYFVETGIFGFLFKIIIFLFIIFLILKKRSNFRIYFFAGFIGLNVASLGYETLNYFYNQSFIFVLLYYYSSNYFNQLPKKITKDNNV
jgi:O-antigen ligase